MKGFIKSHPRLFLFYLFLAVISLFFHRPVEIVNAVSQTPVEYVKLIIAPARICLEPFFGPICYYARSHNLVTEHLVLFMWLITIFLFKVLRIFWRLQIQLGKFFKPVPYIARKLSLTPLFALIIISLLAFEMFVPLPSNTIQTNTENNILIDFRCHTTNSAIGFATIEEQINWHQRNGFHAFFLTVNPLPESVDLNSHTYEKTIYDDQNIVVMFGKVFSTNTNLILISSDSTNTIVTDSYENPFNILRKTGDFVFLANPWKTPMSDIQKYINFGVDGLEIAKQGKQIAYDRKIFRELVEMSRNNSLFMLGNTDYYGYGSFCYSWTMFKIEGWSQLNYPQRKQAIYSFLKERQVRFSEVLVYNDRPFVSPSLVFITPIIHSINYFRTLNLWQIISWVIWMLLLSLAADFQFIKTIKQKTQNYELGLYGIPGIFLTGFLFVLKGQLHQKALIFDRGNHILWDWVNIGEFLVWCFGIYSIFLLILQLYIRIRFRFKKSR